MNYGWALRSANWSRPNGRLAGFPRPVYALRSAGEFGALIRVQIMIGAVISINR